MGPLRLCCNRHDGADGALLALVVGGAALVTMIAMGGAGAAAGAGASASAGSVTGTSTPSVRTLLGPKMLDPPGGLALDAAGDLFVADTGHCRVLVLPDHSGVIDGLHVRTGHVAVLAGGSCRGAASMGHPTGVAVDSSGDVYVAEATAQRVQEIRGGHGDGAGGAPVLVTVAGTGTAGFNGDGLTGTASELDEPTGVAVDAAVTSSSPIRPTAGSGSWPPTTAPSWADPRRPGT